MLPLLASLLLSPAVQAAGYYFTDAGTRALGRGTAFVAGADDLSAQYYNPAAISRLQGGALYYSVSGVQQYVSFDRADEPGLEFERIYNEGPYMVIPAFGVGIDPGVRGLRLALGMFSPFAPDMDYPADGPQRYTLIDSLLWEVGFGLTASYRVNDWLALGVTPTWWVLRVRNELSIAAVLSTTPDDQVGDDPTQDIDVGFEVWDRFQPSANFGLLLDPAPWLSVGLSAQPPIHYDALGHLDVDFTGHTWQEVGIIQGTRFTDDDVRMLIDVPWIVRAGAAFRPTERLELELDGVYEGWHLLDVVTITDLDLVIETADYMDDAVVTNDILLPANYRDAWSARLGAEYALSDTFTLRAGGYYETSAIPLDYQGVGTVDGNKYAFTLGGGAHLGRFDLDLALARSVLANRDIEDSKIQLLVLDVNLDDPSNSEVVMGKVVGNGHFQSYLNFGSVSCTWHFGKAGASD